MGRKQVRAALACGLVATAGLATAVGGTEAQQPGPPTGTLQLMQRDRDAKFHFIDVPPRRGGRRANAGDGFVITGPVRDTAGNGVGRLQAHFVITRPKQDQAQVSGTFILSDGHIVISGAETKANPDFFAIAGGTGSYAGARGTLQVTEGKRTTAFLFTFLG